MTPTATSKPSWTGAMTPTPGRTPQRCASTLTPARSPTGWGRMAPRRSTPTTARTASWGSARTRIRPPPAPTRSHDEVRVTEYVFDGSNTGPIPDQVIDPSGATTSISHSAGRVTAVTDPHGVVTEFAYDSGTGEVSSVTVDPAGLDLQTQFTYDITGGVAEVTTPRRSGHHHRLRRRGPGDLPG